jgi:hypothetical protein
MMYLIVVETANVVVELGIIYEPLIIHYGERSGAWDRTGCTDRIPVGKAAALAISPTREFFFST